MMMMMMMITAVYDDMERQSICPTVSSLSGVRPMCCYHIFPSWTKQLVLHLTQSYSLPVCAFVGTHRETKSAVAIMVMWSVVSCVRTRVIPHVYPGLHVTFVDYEVFSLALITTVIYQFRLRPFHHVAGSHGSVPAVSLSLPVISVSM